MILSYRRLRENYHKDNFNNDNLNVSVLLLIYFIQWQPVPDWDGTRDEAILIWIIFGIHLTCM